MFLVTTVLALSLPWTSLFPQPHTAFLRTMSHTRQRRPTLYLIITPYEAPHTPDQWAVLVVNGEGSISLTGTLIRVIGNPRQGFVHDIRRNYTVRVSSRYRSPAIALGRIAREALRPTASSSAGEVVATNMLEEIALSIPPPDPSYSRTFTTDVSGLVLSLLAFQ